jgi:phage I-like protein
MPAVAAKSPLKPAAVRVPMALAAAGSADGSAEDRLPLPPRILIAKWGEDTALDGSAVIVNEQTAACLAANQLKIGREEVALDFEHNTYEVDAEGKPVKSKLPAPIAAMGALSVEPGVGLWFTPRYWTPEGSHYYSGRHYPDISPTVIRNEKGEVIALHSVALTRSGQIAGLHAFSADAGLLGSIKALSSDLHTNSTPSSNTMDYKTALLKLLGLPDTATDEEITAKLTATTTEVETETPATPMSADVRLDAIERRQILDGATAAGKIIPLSAEAIEALPLSTLRTLVDGITPGSVPLVGKTGDTVEGAGIKALSAEEKTACELLGVSEKRFRELNPA